MKGLTKIMIGKLIYMVENSGFSYMDRSDRTVVALAHRGLAGWSRGGKYGKEHWTLTDLGTDTAKHLRAKRCGWHAVFLNPTEYEAARRAGVDMVNYALQRQMPVDRNDRVKPDYSGGVKTGWDAFTDAVKPRRKHINERSCPDDNCAPGLNGKCTACAGEN